VTELRVREGLPARALEFAILTAARSREATGATWAEIDFKGKLWTVRAARMKGGREHRVPLSGRALEILAELPRNGDFIFGGKRDRPIGESAMLRVVREMRGTGHTVHGFRSTFRDWAESTSFPSEMCEIALAHAVGDKTEAAYRRGNMIERRRHLMSAWEAYCASTLFEEGSNV
jgi:integrase